MGVIKKPFKNYNGVDWDKLFFETSEDQITEGWLQKTKDGTNDYCYRKLPGGLIMQWGSYGATSNANGIIDNLITLPVAFSESLGFYGHAYLEREWDDYALRVHTKYHSDGQIRCVLPSGAAPNTFYHLRFFAIGF